MNLKKVIGSYPGSKSCRKPAVVYIQILYSLFLSLSLLPPLSPHSLLLLTILISVSQNETFSQTHHLNCRHFHFLAIVKSYQSDSSHLYSYLHCLKSVPWAKRPVSTKVSLFLCFRPLATLFQNVEKNICYNCGVCECKNYAKSLGLSRK